MVRPRRRPACPAAMAIGIYGTCRHHRHRDVSELYSGALGPGRQPTAPPIQEDRMRGRHSMSRSKSESLLGLTESFFHRYLQNMRGASAHTVRAYRDALKLFYLFLADQKRKPVADLALEDIQSDAVLSFLDHVESRRGNSAATRNCRLAAIRSFVQHLLREDVTRAGQYGRILAIRNKKAIRRTAVYLEPEEARAVMAAIDRRSRNGGRDQALLLFLYNTGARVSEA